jgi:hypothetical protein
MEGIDQEHNGALGQPMTDHVAQSEPFKTKNIDSCAFTRFSHPGKDLKGDEHFGSEESSSPGDEHAEVTNTYFEKFLLFFRL